MHGKPTTPTQIAGFIVALALSAAAGAIHFFFFPGEWYPGLNLPAWAPPLGLYEGIGAVLYLLMAISAWMVWRHHGFKRNQSQMGFYLTQLTLNAIWSWAFFGLTFPGVALTAMLVLWPILLTTVVLFAKRSRFASLLLLPSLLWIFYLGFLNTAIWAGKL